MARDFNYHHVHSHLYFHGTHSQFYRLYFVTSLGIIFVAGSLSHH